MIRSVNIFKSLSPTLPVRLEFWDTDRLIKIIEVSTISKQQAAMIADFIKGKD